MNQITITFSDTDKIVYLDAEPIIQAYPLSVLTGWHADNPTVPIMFDGSYETFEIILSVIMGKIDQYDVSPPIKQLMHRWGLMNDMLHTFEIELEKSKRIAYDSIKRFCMSTNELMLVNAENYDSYEKIFASDKRIVPVQIVCAKDFRNSLAVNFISVGDNLPIYYYYGRSEDADLYERFDVINDRTNIISVWEKIIDRNEYVNWQEVREFSVLKNKFMSDICSGNYKKIIIELFSMLLELELVQVRGGQVSNATNIPIPEKNIKLSPTYKTNFKNIVHTITHNDQLLKDSCAKGYADRIEIKNSSTLALFYFYGFVRV